jgi:molybdopterin molybdotransferase
MSSLLPVDAARARIVSAAAALASEQVKLSEALGRVLAEDVAARRRQPPGDVSAMDGYAVQVADLRQLPAKLRLVGSVAAGCMPTSRVEAGEAMRIFTGALIPEGADMVALQENAGASEGWITITRGEITPGKHIRRGGSDFEIGQVLVARGRRLRPRDIALLAAMGVDAVAVTRRPKVAVLATGDELVRPGKLRGPAQIVAASLDGLLAQIATWGGVPIDLGIAPDRTDAIATAIASAHDADIIVSLGGASVGDHDLVRAALGADGLSLDFWRIAMRPGKPLMSGLYRGRPFLGLPGNPVSSLVCSLLFLKPLMWRMTGALDPALSFGHARLGSALPANDGREDYLRAMLNDGIATPFAIQDSGQLRPLAAADVLVVRPPNDPPRHTGEEMRVLYLDDA